jgi:hypothetical protein
MHESVKLSRCHVTFRDCADCDYIRTSIFHSVHRTTKGSTRRENEHNLSVSAFMQVTRRNTQREITVTDKKEEGFALCARRL